MSKATPTFLSIIIPVYKVEHYLRECLDSVAVSPLNCWEAILVDDGSPDGCPQICDEYAVKDNRFKVIHQKNTGVAAARNAGLDIAKGEWVWFVDSDDVVDMRPVDSMIVWLNENQNGKEKVDLVIFNLETIDANVNENDEKRDVLCEQSENAQMTVNVCVDKNSFLSCHIIFHHQRLWYRRDVIERFGIRFTEGVRLAEDLELMYKYMTLCQHPVKIDTTLYYYREREGSATQNSTYRMKAVEDLQIVFSNLKEWIRKYNIQPEPWLDFRIMKLFQNFLYSASLINGNARVKVNFKNHDDIQKRVREIIADYRSLGFPFVSKMKYRLAIWNIKIYNILNCLYLKLCFVK